MKGKKKRGRPAKKKASQKRNVRAVKVYLLEEELEQIKLKIEGFTSLSNYIRFCMGLGINSVGRKRIHTESAFDFDDEFIEHETDVKVEFRVEENAETQNTSGAKNAMAEAVIEEVSLPLFSTEI